MYRRYIDARGSKKKIHSLQTFSMRFNLLKGKHDFTTHRDTPEYI